MSETSFSYATLDDLQSAGLPGPALANISFDDQRRALQRASSYASTYLRDRYHLPLCCPYDQALVDAVCQIAAWRLMQRRGFNPNTGADVAIRQGYEDACAFLVGVANGRNQLCVREANPASEQPQFGTNPTRGFGGTTGAQDVPFIGPNTWGT